MATAVGLRELKNKLSAYVAKARSGVSISITDRGRIVAELNPPGRVSKAGQPITTVADLRHRGVLHGGGPNGSTLYSAMPRAMKRSVHELLEDERGSH